MQFINLPKILNRKEYQKQKYNLHRANNFTAICEPIV
jgi:hypothetical protein